MNVCRLCLSSDELTWDLTKILPGKHGETKDSVKEVLVKVFRVQLNESSDLSEAVCESCLEKITETHRFYEQILSNQIILERRLSEESVEIPSEVSEGPPKKRRKVSIHPKSQKKSKQKDNVAEEDRIIKEFYGLMCQKCEETPAFDKLSQLRNHMRSIHSIKVTTIECCSKTFKKRGQLLDHAKIHINPEDLTCKQCGKTCHSRYRLKVHLIQHHASDDSKNYPCETCNKRFISAYHLRAHLKVHLTKEEKDAMRTHICTTCQGAFMSKSLLAHHIRQIHENLYTCICDICAKSFKTKMHFLSHYKHVHTNPDQIKVQCQICGKWVANELSLKKHVRLNHDDPGPHICKECGKEAPTKNALISHERYMHKSKDKFKCQFCVKTFKKPIHLKEHTTIHVGGALYRCGFCEKTFNSGANYFKHRKQKHAEELAKMKKE